MLIDILEPGTESEVQAAPVGIDLGTTHSLVAVSQNGSVRILADEKGETRLPSIVWYGATEGRVEVGEAARLHTQTDPANVIFSAKRVMGAGLVDASAAAYAQNTAVTLSGTGEVVHLNAGGKARTAVEVSAEILRTLKKRAETALSQEVYDAVITVPAYFNEAQRQATKDAARLAGLNVLRLLAEPTAAALAYGLNKGTRGTYMVYDLGGGTFDVSLLKLTDGVFRVLATGGDTHLGGDDIDAHIAAYLGTKDVLLTRALKENLTHAETAQAEGCTLTREQLEVLAQPLVDKTIAIAQQALNDAELAAEDLTGVVLVGGSTRMPLVQNAVRTAFGHEPLCSLNPDEVVAHGAALQAEQLSGKCPGGTLLLDVTPLSLGLETMGGLVEKIIHRNTPIPITKAQDFTTFKDGQSAMDIHVVQGERETVAACRSLARFKLSGIPPMAAGLPRIRVVFSIDADGLLTVRAQERTTGTEQAVEVVPSYGLSEAEVATLLKEAHAHAAQDVAARILQEKRLELERACDAAEQLLAQVMAQKASENRGGANGQKNSNDASVIAGDPDRLMLLQTVLRTARWHVKNGITSEAITEAGQKLEHYFLPLAEDMMNQSLKTALVGRAIGEAS